MLTAYISGALMGAADLDRVRALYERLAEACESAGWLAYVPHRRTDPKNAPHVSAGSVYDVDLVELGSADAVVAYLGEPSLGVGAELALAMQAGKSIFGLHEDSREISRFMGGMLAQYRHAEVYRYTTTEDAMSWVRDRLSRAACTVTTPS